MRKEILKNATAKTKKEKGTMRLKNIKLPNRERVAPAEPAGAGFPKFYFNEVQNAAAMELGQGMFVGFQYYNEKGTTRKWVVCHSDHVENAGGLEKYLYGYSPCSAAEFAVLAFQAISGVQEFHGWYKRARQIADAQKQAGIHQPGAPVASAIAESKSSPGHV